MKPVRKQVERQVRDYGDYRIWQQAIKKQVLRQVYDQVFYQVENQVWEQVEWRVKWQVVVDEAG